MNNIDTSTPQPEPHEQPTQDHIEDLLIGDALRRMQFSAVAPLDQYENALIQYLKKTAGGSSRTRLVDLIAIYSWRCEVEPQYAHMADLAEFMLEIVERCDLVGHSGIFGLFADATPERQWYCAIDTSGYSIPKYRDEASEQHWIRLIGVLASRLRMSEVAKLPGYDHDARAKDNPFNDAFAPRE